MFLLSFSEIYSICCSHDRCSSITKPRFLACFTRLIGALLIYRAYGVVSGDVSKFSSRFDVPMIIKSVLTVFRLSLFALSRSQIFMNEGINSLFNSLTFLKVLDRLVSSANTATSMPCMAHGKIIHIQEKQKWSKNRALRHTK